jgi:hypothetical protein
VSSTQPNKLAHLIQDLRREMRRARGRGDLYDLARSRIEAPHEILDWAKSDRRWSFTLAEVMAGDASRPHDLAAGLVLAIADELEEESETLPDNAETMTAAVNE